MRDKVIVVLPAVARQSDRSARDKVIVDNFGAQQGYAHGPSHGVLGFEQDQ